MLHVCDLWTTIKYFPPFLKSQKNRNHRQYPLGVCWSLTYLSNLFVYAMACRPACNNVTLVYNIIGIGGETWSNRGRVNHVWKYLSTQGRFWKQTNLNYLVVNQRRVYWLINIQIKFIESNLSTYIMWEQTSFWVSKLIFLQPFFLIIFNLLGNCYFAKSGYREQQSNNHSISPLAL